MASTGAPHSRKVEGAKTNTPPKRNTYNTLLPSYRVDNMLHSISGRLGWRVNAYSKHSIHGGGGDGSSPQSQGGRRQSQGSRLWVTRGLILGMQGGRVSSWDTRGSTPKIQRDDSTTEPGGIMEVAKLAFDLTWVQYPTMSYWF